MSGQTLSDTCSAGSLVVLGLRRADSSLVVGPGGYAVLHNGDYLILLGTPEDISRFAQVAEAATS